MRLEILEDLLATGGAGIKGVSLFRHHMPSEVNKGVLLKLPLTGVNIDWNLPGYHKTTLQAIIRAQTGATGEALANLVMELLTHRQKVVYEEDGEFRMQVNYILPAHLPLRFPRSDGNSIEWSLNFDACYVL